MQTMITQTTQPSNTGTAVDVSKSVSTPIAADIAAAVAALAKALQRRCWMVVCAESCTGGLLAAALTDMPGSSAWFERGFVTYSNAAKIEHLGVQPGTLTQYGAVSSQTAEQMALGALRAANVQLAIATTGIAGPDGGTPGKPVGTVCFGFAWRSAEGQVHHRDCHTQTHTRFFPGTRQQVRQASVAWALQQALRVLA